MSSFRIEAVAGCNAAAWHMESVDAYAPGPYRALVAASEVTSNCLSTTSPGRVLPDQSGVRSVETVHRGRTDAPGRSTRSPVLRIRIHRGSIATSLTWTSQSPGDERQTLSPSWTTEVSVHYSKSDEEPTRRVTMTDLPRKYTGELEFMMFQTRALFTSPLG
ncbi:hypothetical protein CKAH01_11322 [Colletotrichum kahawae]|uniref:Uncharacterized protein n=1 Tax=Colletotrichum kahawae TaxID=34407 RepID=A0AAD9YTY5_COLKA|nr:hypothetical protein CKAH01_11322 [Colletotrichum kahawae]